MKSQRCVEAGGRPAAGQPNMRYHSEEGLEPQLLARLRKNMHSNQSHYLPKHFRDRLRSIDLNEQTATPAADTQKVDSRNDKDLTLPQIAFRQTHHDAYKILLKKSKAFGNIAALQGRREKREQEERMGQEKRVRSVAYLSSLGGRTRNEDRVAVNTISTRHGLLYHYWAVFDGHGGYLTSNYLSLHLHLVLESFLNEQRPPADALRLSLALLEDKLRKNPRIGSKSGSCALVCLAAAEDCWIANVGDSRFLTIASDGQLRQVTRDHKPEEEAERTRILNAGGDVYRHIPDDADSPSRRIPFRVYPGKLSVSRAIGDVHIKRENSRVVIAEPEIFSLTLRGLSHLLLLTDGVYERLSNAEIAGCFQAGAEEGVRAVFELAEQRRSEDNRSIVAVRLK